MSLKKTKRVKLIDAQGSETHAEDSRWTFFQKARVQVKARILPSAGLLAA